MFCTISHIIQNPYLGEGIFAQLIEGESNKIQRNETSDSECSIELRVWQVLQSIDDDLVRAARVLEIRLLAIIPKRRANHLLEACDTQ
jgi:hypothetical protein